MRSELEYSIDYVENKTLETQDIEHDATAYKIGILGKNVIIAIGKRNDTFIDKNIVYYPVYLIKDNKFNMQIGVYEVLFNQLSQMLDDDDDLDLENYKHLLLYSFTIDVIKNLPEDNNFSFKITKSVMKKDKDDDEKDKKDDANVKDDDAEKDDDDDEKDKDDDDKKNVLSEQSKSDAKYETAQFKNYSGITWVEQFMKNMNYGIVNNEGGGDCLFASIRDGLAMGGKSYTVNDLRTLLSDQADKNTFKTYQQLYNDLKITLNNTKQQLKLYQATHKSTLQKIKKYDQEELSDDMNKINDEYESLKKTYQDQTSLYDEFKIMKGVKTLNQFKDVIMTCDFWGDTWAISTLERILQIKLIILSKESYTNNQFENVLNCGQLNDSILEQKQVFDPTYYIIVEHSENHYRLITYKDHAVFSFKEIPYDIKTMIVNRCLEKNIGPFHLISDFKKFKKTM